MTTMSTTAVGILAGHVKWIPCEGTPSLVSDMSSCHLRNAIGCCVNKGFTNNGLTSQEWFDILSFELERREGPKKREFQELKEVLKLQRNNIKVELEDYLTQLNRALDLAHQLDYQTGYLTDYKVKALKALADLR